MDCDRMGDIIHQWYSKLPHQSINQTDVEGLRDAMVQSVDAIATV